MLYRGEAEKGSKMCARLSLFCGSYSPRIKERFSIEIRELKVVRDVIGSNCVLRRAIRLIGVVIFDSLVINNNDAFEGTPTISRSADGRPETVSSWLTIMCNFGVSRDSLRLRSSGEKVRRLQLYICNRRDGPIYIKR